MQDESGINNILYVPLNVGVPKYLDTMQDLVIIFNNEKKVFHEQWASSSA